MTTIPIFERIKKTAEDHIEYWSARELSKVLEYLEYRNFVPVVKKAKESCKNAGQSIKKHFVDVHDMIKIGKTASRQVGDTLLSRYACYLLMQNADPSKEVVALGQTYFAIQTRRQEVNDELVEDQKRLFLRGEMTAKNKHLFQTANVAGVKDFAKFTNYGYKGLYGGLDMQRIHQRKKLKKSQHILDLMTGEELGANVFRATQTEAKLHREQIRGQTRADQTHFEVGKKIRRMIKELGGTMPEKLPTPDNIVHARKRVKKATEIKQISG